MHDQHGRTCFEIDPLLCLLVGVAALAVELVCALEELPLAAQAPLWSAWQCGASCASLAVSLANLILRLTTERIPGRSAIDDAMTIL